MRSIPVGGWGGADFLPDASMLYVTDCDAGAVHAIDVATGTIVDRIETDGCPTFLDIGADGSRLLLNNVGFDSGSQLQLFSLPKGDAMGSFEIRDHASGVRLDDAGDGTTALTGGTFLGVRWDVDPDAWVTSACALVGRNLTLAEWAEHLPGEPYATTCDAYPADEAQPSASTVSDPSADPAAAPDEQPGGEALSRASALCAPQEEACWQPPGRVSLDPHLPRISLEFDGSWEVVGTSSEGVVRLSHDPDTSVEVGEGGVGLVLPEGAAASGSSWPEHFVEALSGHEGIAVRDVRVTDLAGVAATTVDVDVASDMELFAGPASGRTYAAAAGQRIRFLLATIEGRDLYVAAAAPADGLDRFWEAAAGPLIETFEVGEG